MKNIITALERHKNNKNKINIYINHNFAFTVDINSALMLYTGRVLSEDDIRQIRTDDLRRNAYQHAIRFLAVRNRSQVEMRQYLENKGYSSELITLTIERLGQEKYLDDEQFARQWIENRERFTPRGAYALRYELRHKGITDRIIDLVLSDFDEEASARKAIDSKMNRWQNMDKPEFQKKAGGFLSRRGFNFEITRDTLAQAWERFASSNDIDL